MYRPHHFTDDAVLTPRSGPNSTDSPDKGEDGDEMHAKNSSCMGRDSDVIDDEEPISFPDATLIVEPFFGAFAPPPSPPEGGLSPA